MSRVIWTYLLITYVVTWSIILISYYFFKQSILTRDQLNLIYNLGALGPLAGAIISAKLFYGKRGLKTLASQVNFKKLNKMSLVLAIIPLVFFIFGLVLYPLFMGHAFTFAETQRQYNLTTGLSYVGWILPFVSYSIFEEFGWRGFMLPHLQSKFSAFSSTILLTIFWAGWHLPFFLWRFQFSLGITLGFFFSIFIGAVIITSIYNFSRGSIVPVILFHFTNNIASAFDKEFIVAVVSTGFVFLAIYLIKKYRTINLADVPRVKNIYT